MASNGIDRYDVPSFLRKQADDDSSPQASPRSEGPRVSFSLLMDSIGLPQTKANADAICQDAAPCSPLEFIAAIEARLVPVLRLPKLPRSIRELDACGLDPALSNRLRELVSDGHDEDEVIAAFIHALAKSNVGDSFGRSFKRAILKVWKKAGPGAVLDRLMAEALVSITQDEWNWQGPVRAEAVAACARRNGCAVNLAS